MALLSVLIPVYNEEDFIETLLQRVLDAPLPEGLERELVVVDDCSRDQSAARIESFLQARPEARIQFFRHEQNQGKGAALRTAIQHATGEYTIIQDADLEYNPQEYPQILRPLREGYADAVFGSRFMAAGERRVLYFWHSLANHMLTLLCNVASDLNLTDMETCYKAFRTPLLKSIPIRSNRFGFEPEITIKLAQRRARIYETPISYHGRTYDEGKKIGLKDAFDALWVIVKTTLANDCYAEAGPEILDTLSLARKFNRWMADTIAPYVGERVLEIGAGIGNLTRQLAPKRPYYAATDIDPEHLEILHKQLRMPNLEVRYCDLSDSRDMAQFHDAIDTVVCLNVLEHVEDDLGSLRNMHMALRQGGKAIVLVPHDQRIFGRLDEVLGHFRRYSHEQLRARFEEAGFRVERILEFNRPSRPGWYVTGKVLQRDRIARFPLRCFDALVPVWRKIDHLIPWPPTSIIAIGVKD